MRDLLAEAEGEQVTAKAYCTCTHPAAIHHAQQGACRISGCGCREFTDTERAERVPTSRTVTFEIPDGYVLNVQLVPIEAAAPVEVADAA